MGRGPVEEKICKVPGCDRTLYARELCRRHYQQWRRSGKPTTDDIISNPSTLPSAPDPKCTEPGCSRTRVDSRYCNMHRQINMSGEPPVKPKDCSEEGCPNKARTRGMCNKHYQRWFRDHQTEDGRLSVKPLR